jgi:acetyltransferase-like isoleucine patch superfamily enzyme
MVSPINTTRDKLRSSKQGALRKYRDITVGETGFFYFLLYEFFSTLLGPIPGALGIVLRRFIYRYFFTESGKNLVIGQNVVIRHPKNISIGNNVIIDDNCLIDAHGCEKENFIIEDDVIINRNCSLQAKNGFLRIGKRSSIGGYTLITSLQGVIFGENVLVGGRCYFSSGTYNFDEQLDTSIMDSGLYSKGLILIKDDCYFGAGSLVVGGVRVGHGAVVGAASLVLEDVGDNAVVAGNPAKFLRVRKCAE